ncbi:hypothetical protein [Rhizobium leguminosarum]|uniref:hypothetical protein n=1 Tax=Rhizobium leguminosarum TaxID=384 RepID=UPI0013BBD0C0|nr:hypothetical protein [Rhizobium leguminosarum]NEI60903.1 hypothetical protein [Rhizobium leguminosarum]
MSLTRVISQMFDSLANGVGAISRNLANKLGERTSVADYDTFAHASAQVAVAGGTLYGGPGDDVAMQAMPPTNVTYQYDGPGGLNGLFSYNGADVEAKQFIHDHLRFNNDVGNHLLATKSVHTIAEGGTINGPARASVAHAVSLMKKGYGDGTAKGGEMDGIYLVVRQDQRDGVRADACGILIDAAFYDNDGFVGGIEGATQKNDKVTQAALSRLVYQIGCMDHAASQEIAYFASADYSEISYGLKLDGHISTGGYFSNYISCSNGSWDVFNINRNGEVTLRHDLSGTSMAIRVGTSGNFGVLNNAKTVELFTVFQNGGIRLAPQASAPTVAQGAVYFDSVAGKLKVCEDGVNWRTVTTS